MTHSIKLDIVSAEKLLFSGEVLRMSVSGELGELGIMPGHTPLLSPLKPGSIRYVMADEQEHWLYVSGGLIEVQPTHVTVLADEAIRAEELDEAHALRARQLAEEHLKQSQDDRAFDINAALAECAQAAAQLQLIKLLRHARRK